MNVLNRYLPYFVAACLPILMFDWFVPDGVGELDRYALWLVAMVLVGLPVLLAELALARRSGQGVWLGMQKLTREADAPIYWRVFAGLSVFVVVLMAALMVSGLAVGLTTDEILVGYGIFGGVPTNVLAVILMAVTLILSLLKARLAPLGTLLVLAAALLTVVTGGVSLPVMTGVSLTEWTQALVMALVSVGSGTGLYWFMSQRSVGNTTAVSPAGLTQVALPIWLTQLVVGLFAILVVSGPQLFFVALIAGLGVLLVSSYLMYYAYVQAISRFGMLKGAATVTILALLIAALPSAWLSGMVMGLSLIMVLVFAIFVGWLMKISHLRKSLNFASEARYNIWRVFIRLVVPLSVLIALAGLVGMVL